MTLGRKKHSKEKVEATTKPRFVSQIDNAFERAVETYDEDGKWGKRAMKASRALVGDEHKYFETIQSVFFGLILIQLFIVDAVMKASVAVFELSKVYVPKAVEVAKRGYNNFDKESFKEKVGSMTPGNTASVKAH